MRKKNITSTILINFDIRLGDCLQPKNHGLLTASILIHQTNPGIILLFQEFHNGFSCPYQIVSLNDLNTTTYTVLDKDI